MENRESWETYRKRKIVSPLDLEELISSLRAQNKTIATLNGSFDLLHAGHLFILYEASLQADVLLIALNSDCSIQGYKGPSRPIIPLERRLEMMAAIEYVSYVTWFDELDPRAILERIKPDVHVNGAEYGENCIEAEVVRKHGGKMHLVPRIATLSTSDIIKRIQTLG